MFRHNSNRLSEFNYASEGAYFVTSCTKSHVELFGEIRDEKMVLSEVGLLVEKWWLWLESQYTYIQLDEFVVMPNHLHGILSIVPHEKGVSRNAPTEEEESKICRGGSRTAQKIKPLGQIIGAFKTVSTKQINIILKDKIKLWQRGYYDHIIRNEKELSNIRKYIQNNPLQWHLDIENRQVNQKIEALAYYKNIFEK